MSRERSLWEVAGAGVLGIAIGATGILTWQELSRRYGKKESTKSSQWSLKPGDWYVEKSTFWPGQTFALCIKEMLYEGKSEYQDIKVFESTDFGRVLVLDGCIQCTEKDECSYQEMLAHVPMFAHPKPRRILIIGGGDGGIAREILKHECVESLTMCEIDEMVTKVARQYLPTMATAFDHPKLKLVINDGAKFVEQCAPEEYDIIVVDSSDPVGPAGVLMQEPFHKHLQRILAKGGICVCQGECFWIHLPLIKQMAEFCKNIYSRVDYSSFSVPTYPCGTIGMLVLAKESGTELRNPLPTRISENDVILKTLKYYTPAVHLASFQKPNFLSSVFDT